MSEEPRTRIARLTASNFLSLGRVVPKAGAPVSVDLGDVTVLAGINGSGKSNVLTALAFVATALEHGLDFAVTQRGGFSGLRLHRGGRDVTLRLELRGDDRWSAEYELKLAPRGKEEFVVQHERATVRDGEGAVTRLDVRKGKVIEPQSLASAAASDVDLTLRLAGADPHFVRLYEALRDVRAYSIYPGALRRPTEPVAAPYLDAVGVNWARFIDRMKGGEKELFRQVLLRTTGDITDARRKQVGDHVSVWFDHEHGEEGGAGRRSTAFPASRESDGTLRMAGLAVALMQRPPLTLIGIEEPELTIHPGMLPVIVELVRSVSDRSQVVLTSHSPELLDLVENPDEIRVVERTAGVTAVAPLAQDQVRLVQDRLMLPGELLRTEGLVPRDDDEPA